MWRNLSLRKSIILYISAFVILAILLSAGTATLCNNATKTIESKYPPTGEKYYLTNENGERLGDGNYIGVAPVAMSEKDQRLLSICEVAPIIATPIYSALCIITATLLFYRNKLKKPLTELKAASEMISNNNLDFSIKYDSKDELGELCSSFETMRFTLANNFSEMWRQMEERKQLNLQGIKKIPRQNGTLETWSSHFIRLILDNPVYCGKIAYGRRTREKVKGTKNEYKQVHTDDYILEDGQHEGIVSEELWQKAHTKRMATGIKQPSKIGKDRSHLLTGILKCPICGSSMYTNKHAWTNKDGTWMIKQREY